VVDDFQKLREGLRALPVPEPRPGFVDRALAKATASGALPAPRREPRAWFAVLTRPLTWGAAAAGALAASLVWLIVMAMRFDAPIEPSLQLALHESREISLVIDSERALEGATIRLYATGSIALVGFEEQSEVEWLASLNEGANLLSLPVVAREPGQGSIVAEIEHGGKTRRVNVLLQVRG
jgi:hypothetical protein